MRPAVATVVTAAPWERELVTAARLGGLVRMIGRCRSPFDVDQALERVDAVVIGAETSWLSPALIRRWRSTGTVVVGMVPPGDRPAAEMMAAGGADVVFGHHEPPVRVLAAVVSGSPMVRPPAFDAVVATVVGPRGAPGRSEIALALAWALAPRRRTLLVELDGDAPGLGLRLGLEPHPGLDRSDPSLGTAPRYRRHDPIEVLTLPPDLGPLSQSLTSRVVDAARAEFGCVVIDAGPRLPESLGLDPGVPVMVVEPTPIGLVRASRMAAAWSGPQPVVVANRMAPGDEASLRSIRAATGLEPVATVPDLGKRLTCDGPTPPMVEALSDLTRWLFAGSGGLGRREAAVPV
jgi:hypothetical protein